VPLHPRRIRERGFNQARVLGEELGRIKGIPIEASVLKKVRNSPPQTSLTQEERMGNVRGAYDIVHKEKIRGKIVLLVDDVFTTGSTIQECAIVLKKAGAQEVRAVTVAQA
jgi:ComF family protein